MVQAHGFTKKTESIYEQFLIHVNEFSEHHHIGKRVDEIRNTANSLLRKAENECERIHEDFRDDAVKSYRTLRDRINKDLERYGFPVLESVSV